MEDGGKYVLMLEKRSTSRIELRLLLIPEKGRINPELSSTKLLHKTSSCILLDTMITVQSHLGESLSSRGP